jgi:threonine dehydratase
VSPPTLYAVDLADVRAAAQRIQGHVHRTPILTSQTLDELAGRPVLLKCENLQRGGSFKLRGALNALASLPDDVAARGVVTHSSGNFAQGVALAARARGVPAHIVMPNTAPVVKQQAVAGYGGRITLCAPTLAARQAMAERIRQDTGASLLHPYDQAEVIAGQGTIALEVLEDRPDVTTIVVPVGGGGLVSGIALATRELRPDVAVYAAEPAGADDAWRSRRSGIRTANKRIETVADGLLPDLGDLAWPVVRDIVADVIRVEEAAIVAALRLLVERTKLVVEPSGAVPLAAVLAGVPGDGPVAVVLSGGNVDPARLGQLLG